MLGKMIDAAVTVAVCGLWLLSAGGASVYYLAYSPYFLRSYK